MTGTSIYYERLPNQKAEPVSYNRPLPVKVSGDTSSQFDELVVANRTPLIELNSSYGVSAIRDVTLETGSASIAGESSGEIKISTGTTGASLALLESAELGRYIPGFGAEFGIGVRIPTLPTGNQNVFWGAATVERNDGIYFGVDATGPYVAVLRNSVETKIRQDEWNIDKLDGTGASGVTLDLTEGTIFQVDFTWYGYGNISWGIITPVAGKQTLVRCHQFKPNEQTSVESPNLNLFVYAGNGGTETNIDVYVGGRQYAIVGRYLPKYRYSGESRGTNASKVSTSTTRIPLVTFRAKTAFRDRSIRLQKFSAIVSSEPVIIEFVLNGSLTGASYSTPTNHTAAETALEVDTSATAISGGVTIWGDLIDAGRANRNLASEELLEFDIPQDQPITMCARTTSGTGSIIAYFQMREEW